MRPKQLKVSLGVFAYNEEVNIGAALKSILDSRTDTVHLQEVLVVSSGSFDGTNAEVRRWQKRDRRVKLITQSQRYGKAAAVNLFLRHAISPVVVTLSADLVLKKTALEELCSQFWDEGVGMAGAHPVPKPVRGGKLNREIALLWQLHHEVSLVQPKCGEMVAFRNIIREMPEDSAVDEATLEVMLKIVGYTVRYAPRAVVYNKGARDWQEFVTQRRRVQAGHEWVKQRFNYTVATMVPDLLMRTVATHLWQHPADGAVMLRLMVMEVIARTLGFIDFYVWKRNPYKWQMISR